MRSFAFIVLTLSGCYIGGSEGSDASADAAHGIPDGNADVPCTQIPLPDGGPVHVTGVVVQPDGVTPVPNAMLAVEYGGLYLPWCDLSHASPYYVFGTIADATGKFAIDVRSAMLGFHSFASGYYYSRASLDTTTGATTVTLQMGQLPTGQATPTVTNMGFSAATVAAGAMVTFSATLTTWSPNDPLSDENLLVEPTTSFGIELNPPSVGKKDNFPNGVWSATFAAPATKGTYTYYFSSTTAGCITSNVMTSTLKVQ